jgi:hypothetical protein
MGDGGGGGDFKLSNSDEDNRVPTKSHIVAKWVPVPYSNWGERERTFLCSLLYRV